MLTLKVLLTIRTNGAQRTNAGDATSLSQAFVEMRTRGDERMQIANRKRNAFSLVELVMMLAIISILAAIAGPRYANSLALYRATAAAQRIAGDLNLARCQARISSSGQTVAFNVASNNYSLPGMAPLPGQPSPYKVNLSSDPYSASLLTTVFGSSSTMSFDRFGQPGTGGTITVKSGSFVKTIIVDSNTGLATVQ